VIELHGKFVTSTSGTILSSSCYGFTVAKTGSEAGRYTITLKDAYPAFLGATVALVSAQADTAYTTDKGLIPFWRSVAPQSKSMLLQFATGDSNGDEEIEDGASVYLTIKLQNSSW
jgi:hypothetical protein